MDSDKIFITKFDTTAQYNAAKDSLAKPHVSLTKDDGKLHYMKHDYSIDYLTFVALESGTISFNIWKSMGTDMITSISYSKDNGETWTTTNNVDNKSEHLVINVSVNEGDEVLWKGNATQTGYYDEYNYADYVGSFFSSTCEFDAKGNVMSLLYGDNFKGETTIEESSAFCRLFNDYDREKICSIVNANNLSLPATTLTSNCYIGMFQGCTSLVTAPSVLPATTLTSNCYIGMFQGCTSLVTAPSVLPATTLADSCYNNMFGGCTNLTTAPELPATTLAESCCEYMFSGCTSLVTAPSVLPAETLARNCYDYMFNGCTSLVTAPELLATTLAYQCYADMFDGCTSLTAAPELSATTLAEECYSYMFKGCTSLVNAPELPAETLARNCYDYMFNGCTNLNYIKAMFTTTPSTNYTNSWVNGVASSGTFVKNASATWTITGVNGVPNGWTVQTASN